MRRHLEAATGMLGSDPTAAGALVEQVGDEANRALEDLRDVPRGFFPPPLTDRALVVVTSAPMLAK